MISVYYQIRARVTRYLVYAGTNACHKAGTQHCLQHTRRRYGHIKAGPGSFFLGRPSGSWTHFSIAAGPLPDRYRQTSAINKCITLHRHPCLLLKRAPSLRTVQQRQRPLFEEVRTDTLFRYIASTTGCPRLSAIYSYTSRIVRLHHICKYIDIYYICIYLV